MKYAFLTGDTYSRADVYRIVDVPPQRRRGNWETGYNQYEGDLFIFCNIGVPGRSGHDYDNHWEGDSFVWKAKEGTNVNQPQIQWMQNPTGEIYLFTRESNSDPFTFQGLATADEVMPTTPVTIRWRIDRLQPSLPVIATDIEQPAASRVETTTYRIVRDTRLAQRLKALHEYKCQLCGTTIALNDGSFYCEAHHIQPLGQPHNGPDVEGNILVVCPNHHAMCDFGAITLTLDMVASRLGHEIEQRFLDYHNSTIVSGI